MRKHFYWGAMALGLLLTGCSSDEILQEPDKVLESDQDYFVSVRISGDVMGTRAAGDDGKPEVTDFETGTGTESTISSVYFVFYDNEGNVIGDPVPAEVDNSNWQQTAVADGSVEKFYKSVVKVSVMRGEKQPAQVICYLNPISAGNLNVSLQDIQTLQLDNVYSGSLNTETGKDSRSFAMSNSVYYPNSGETTLPNIAVPLENGVNLFETEEKAEAASNNNQCAEIYVERYASKLAFDATNANLEDFVTGQRMWDSDGNEIQANKITLRFQPQFWAVNAESKKSYVIKSFRTQATDGSLLPDNFTFAALNANINKGITDVAKQWIWNAPEYHRSYWGMSPAYFTKKYPEVSSDLDAVNHTELQKYISYNELLNKEKGFAAGNTTPQYFKETTVGLNALDSRNPAAAVASVIYVGKYSVQLNDGPVLEDTRFYTYLSGPVPGEPDADNQPYVYFDNDPNSVTSAVRAGESMLKRFLVQCNILFKKVGNEYVRYELGDGNGFNDLMGFLSVSELNEAEKLAYDGSEETTLKLQHNARTLRFTKEQITPADNIYILTYEGYKQVLSNATNSATQIGLTAANIALARNVGYALEYTSGHAYFNIPVKHLGWYRPGNENTDDAVIDWNKVNVGDFGMVRNHSYSIKVNNVVGLASGIGGDDVELVPPAFSQDYYISYRVHILKWAVVPTQSVDL